MRNKATNETNRCRMDDGGKSFKFVFLLVLRRMRLIFFLLINFNLFRLLFELNLINTVHKSLIMQSFLFANLFIIFCCFHLFCSFPFFFLLLCLPFHLFKLELESLTSSVFYSIFTHDHTTNEKKMNDFCIVIIKTQHTRLWNQHTFSITWNILLSWHNRRRMVTTKGNQKYFFSVFSSFISRFSVNLSPNLVHFGVCLLLWINLHINTLSIPSI